ncbi:MAG: hypothetical protein GTN80_09305 [Nitrososphaeria archaeon]|nr:hypothetical protein [Nitrososphaeria archaeon]NIN53351.1 hypothetical protein [Nitrososphaeria archaeon]NIQ33817.1 hypothetical protein [Nitrososphaeria archaeon]
MKLKKIAAVYGIIVGLMMMGFWIMYVYTGQVPEFETEPWDITLHIVAEFLTSFALLIGGIGLYTERNRVFHIYLVSMGMLLYTVIASTGHFADLGDTAMVMVFAILTILTLISISLIISKREEFELI